MKCDFCDKKATVFLTQLVEGQMKKVCLCDACAKERGVTDPTGFSLADLLLGGAPGAGKGTVTPVKTPISAGGGRKCPGCGFTLEDLQLTSAGDLVDVCSVVPEDEHYPTAMAFCYGFFEGAIRYAEAITGASYHKKLVCAPDGTTRVEAVEVFVTYMNHNVEYLDDAPVDGIYRALIPRWPCKE